MNMWSIFLIILEKFNYCIQWKIIFLFWLIWNYFCKHSKLVSESLDFSYELHWNCKQLDGLKHYLFTKALTCGAARRARYSPRVLLAFIDKANLHFGIAAVLDVDHYAQQREWEIDYRLSGWRNIATRYWQEKWKRVGQIVTDRRNRATDVRRNAATNRCVVRHPQGVKQWWGLPLFGKHFSGSAWKQLWRTVR